MLPRALWVLPLVGAVAAVVIAGLYWQRWQGAAVPQLAVERQVRVKQAGTKTRSGTPTPTRAATGSAASSGPRLGQATVLSAPSGAPIAAIIVRGVTDPLPAGPGTPAAGQRLVGVVVAVINLGSDPLPVPLSAFGLRDHAGAVHAPLTAGVAVASPSTAAQRSTAPRRASRPRGQPARQAAGTPAAASAATPASREPSGPATIMIGPGETQNLALRFRLPATTAIDTLLVRTGGGNAVTVARVGPVLPATPVANGAPSSRSPTGGKGVSRRAATPAAASKASRSHGAAQTPRTRPARAKPGRPPGSPPAKSTGKRPLTP